VLPVTTANEPPALPFERPNVLDLAPLYRALQAEHPIARVRTPAGDAAWLVTGYPQVRALLADEALRVAHPEPKRAPRLSDTFFFGGPVGNHETERADRARMRRVLAPTFMVKRMNALRPRVQAHVDELLQRLAGLAPPVDLHEELSFPFGFGVICGLLGVPDDDRTRLREWTDQSMNIWGHRVAVAGFMQVHGYMRELLQRRRSDPREDVISDLLGAQHDDNRLSEASMLELCMALLFAGHEPTVSRIDLGTLLLLTHPDQREALREDPSLVHGAVEEILRMSAPGLGVLIRYASEAVAIDGVTIRAGEMVLLSTETANRDDRVIADPDRFDIRRPQNPHLAFGYGERFCPGAALARVELQAVFGTLFQRLPTLRLAVPLDELRLRPHTPLGGLQDLPVTW
jgi:pentalenolactone synthase